MSTIQISPYPLNRHGLNSSRGKEGRYFGTLIRARFPWGDGYADYAPWEKSLEDTLSIHAKESTQFQQSLLFAWIDSLYRSRQINMFEHLQVPESHKTLSNWLSMADDDASEFYEQGFRRFKLKVGRDEAAEVKKLTAWIERLPQDVHFRLDFNQNCRHRDLWKSVMFCERIDFVEDPTVYDEDLWRELEFVWKCELALDMADQDEPGDWTGCSVMKPAIDPFLPKYLLQDCVVTSYMDHPVGQCFAAWSAGLIATVNPQLHTCGLLTHDLVGIESWLPKSDSPEFPIPHGSGIGFDTNLNLIKWTDNCNWNGIDHAQWFSQIPEFMRARIEKDLNVPLSSFR